MKLIVVEFGPLVYRSQNGFPVTRDKNEDQTTLTYDFRPDGVSIPIDPSLAEKIPGSLLMQAAIKMDADGRPRLVPESAPGAQQYPEGSVLVSSGYNHTRRHIRFECNQADLGVIYTYAPAITDNWSQRSFLAVMRPGTQISFVVQSPLSQSGPARLDGSSRSEESVPLLKLSQETGKLEYLYNELPFMDTTGGDDWMRGLNFDADVQWKRALHRRRFG